MSTVAMLGQVLRASALTVLLVTSLAACTAVGVVATDDPYEKLGQAGQLEYSGRLSRARQLILEAIDIFEAEEDALGRLEGYRRYGFFLRAYGEDAVLRLDSATSEPVPSNEDGRMDKSIVYFQKALAIAEAENAPDLMTNLHYNIGISHRYAGRPDEACASLDRSLAAYRKARDVRPDQAMELPAGVKDFPELIDRTEKELELTCE